MEAILHLSLVVVAWKRVEVMLCLLLEIVVRKGLRSYSNFNFHRRLMFGKGLAMLYLLQEAVNQGLSVQCTSQWRWSYCTICWRSLVEKKGSHAVPFVGGPSLKRREAMLYYLLEVLGWKEWRSCCTICWKSLAKKKGSHAVLFVGGPWLKRREAMLYHLLEVHGWK